MSQQNTIKAKALVRDEIVLLLELLSKHKVLTTKSMNATNNQVKEQAWTSIAQEFGAMTGTMRRLEQLRLKWENLKKASRKRSAIIRQNNLKKGGGKAFIGPDEVLDRVASLLGVTCTGFYVEFGGDRESETVVSQVTGAMVEVVDMQPLPDFLEIGAANNVLVLGDDGDGVIAVGSGSNTEAIITPKKFFFNTPEKTTVGILLVKILRSLF